LPNAPKIQNDGLQPGEFRPWRKVRNEPAIGRPICRKLRAGRIQHCDGLGTVERLAEESHILLIAVAEQDLISIRRPYGQKASMGKIRSTGRYPPRQFHHPDRSAGAEILFLAKRNAFVVWRKSQGEVIIARPDTSDHSAGPIKPAQLQVLTVRGLVGQHAVYRNGKRRSSSYFTVFLKANDLPQSRFGFSIKRALGGAVRAGAGGSYTEPATADCDPVPGHALMARRYGDRVRHFATFNEPNVCTLFGYGMGWNARLASSYMLGSDLLRGGAETMVRMQMLTAAFSPLNTLTISPTLGYREEVQDWSGVRTHSPSASVALQYRQSQQVLISAMGNYAGTRSSDGLIDTEQVGGKGRLAWAFQRSQTWTTLISLEAGYSRMTNHVTPVDDRDDISALLRLALAAL
jgi:hypothetical protein